MINRENFKKNKISSSIFFCTLLLSFINFNLFSQTLNYSRIPNTSGPLKVGDKLLFSIQTPTDITPSSIYGSYNSRTLKWSLTSGSLFTSEYIVTEGEPDQTSPLDLTDVTFTANTGVVDVFNWTGIIWSIDAHTPKIVSIQVPDGINKVGDIVTFDINTDNSGEAYQLYEFKINNVVLSSPKIVFNTISNTQYSINYKIQQGDLDISTGAIKISLILSDIAGNKNEAFTTINPNNLSVYANPPTISQIVSSANTTGILKIGDKITFNLTSIGNIINLNAIGSYNNKELKWIPVSATNFSAEYIVSENDNDQIIPLQINGVFLKDIAGNESSTFTGSDLKKIIDASKPVINSIVSNAQTSQILKIGSVIHFVLTSLQNENGGTVQASYNGQNLVWIQTASNKFESDYTIFENDFETIQAIQIKEVILKDAAGNESNSFDGTDIQSIIDSHKPNILALTSNASDEGVLKIGDKINFTLSTLSDETDLTINAKYNSIPLNWTKVSSNNYTAEYIVLAGHSSHSTPLQLNGVVVIDKSGNQSNVFSGTDIKKSIAAQNPILRSLVSNSNASGILKIGDRILFTLTTATPNSNANINATYLGRKLNWIEVSSTVYTSEYLVTEGIEDQISPIQLTNVLFTDQFGNSSIISGVDILKTIDANKPVVKSITSNANSFGIFKIGDQIKFTLKTNSNENGANVKGIYNSVLLNFIQIQENVFEAIYTVASKDNDQLLPIQLTDVIVKDFAGNESIINYSYDVLKTIDANAPEISSIVSIPDHSGILKVGDKIKFILTPNLEDPFLNFNSNMYNNQLLNWSTNDGGKTYFSYYTVKEGDPSQISPIQLTNVIIKDLAKNESLAFSTSDINVKIDAHSPLVLQMTVGAGDKIIGDNVVIDIVTDNSGEIYSVDFLEVNKIQYPAVNLKFSSLSKSTYRIIYSVSENDNNVLAGTLSIKIKLIDKSGNISPVYSDLSLNTLSIFSMKPKAKISGGGTVCADSFATVNFEFEGEAPFTLEYSLNGFPQTIVSGLYTSVYTLISKESEVYKIENLYDAHNNSANLIDQTLIVTVNPLPFLSFDLKPVYNVLDKVVNLNPNVQGGEFKGKGVLPENNQFYPSLVSIGGPYPITYTYKDGNGCSNSLTQNVYVHSSTGGMQNLKSSYCLNDEIDTITAIVSPEAKFGGVFKGAGITNIGSNQALFYPLTSEPGIHTIIFSYTGVDNVDYDVVQEVEVKDTTKVSIQNIPTSYCENSGILKLKGVPQDSKGSFTGVGLIDNGNGTADFDPKQSNIGELNKVIFTYEASQNCVSHVVRRIMVNPTPSVLFQTFEMNNKIRADSICVNNGQIYLKGYPSDGTFTGGNVLNTSVPDSVIFLPSQFINGGSKTINYLYQNPQTLCSNSFTKDLTVLVVPKVEIQGLNTNYCLRQQEPLVIGKVDGLSIKEGSFYTNNVLSNTNNGEFYLNTKNTGEYSIKFEYTTKQACVSSVSQTIKINDLPKVQFNNLAPKYCKNSSPVTLSGFPSGGTFVIGTTVFADPVIFKPGEYDGSLNIRYNYTDENKCLNNSERSTVVYPKPDVAFEAPGFCYSDSIIFKNKTTNAGSIIKTWLWDFDDPLSLNKNNSNLKNPKHFYTNGGAKNVKLTATTQDGCSESQSLNIILTSNPKVSFVWKNECLGSDPVILTGSTTETVSQWTWYLGDGKKANDQSIKYFYSKPGAYKVSLVGLTGNGCRDSISHFVSIRPTINISSQAPYQHVFANGSGGWIKESVNDTINSWSLGIAKGNIIKSSGNDSIWYTALNSKYYKEQSWVSSPCFDFTDAKKPIFNFKILSIPNKGRDGVVLQYKQDTAAVWLNLGSELDGVNWYNATEILGNPGQQALGQKGWSNASLNTWTDARQSLDVVKGLSKIRFRVAYGTDGSPLKPGIEGFAFDKVRIFERSKLALIENFTNVSSKLCVSFDTTIHSVVNRNMLDLIDINYHCNIPGLDSLFLQNQSDPSARMLYYGVNEVPFTNLRGISRLTFINNLKDSAAKAILFDPLFKIEQKALTENGTLKIVENITALAAINQPVSLYVALVEDSVYYPSASNGQKYFSNVLRKMLPDAGGTNFNDVWNQNDTKSIKLEWNLSDLKKTDKLKLIAFIQNEITKEIYQTNIFGQKISLIEGLDSENPQDEQHQFQIYPNPASNYVFVRNESRNTKFKKIQLLNQLGQIIKEKDIEIDQSTLQLDLSGVSNGMYVICISGMDGFVVNKKLIVEKQ